jgi:preprotein translocase subunit SecD
MLNRYAWWKYLTIALVLAAGLLYALPNLFGKDPAIQVSPDRGADVDQSTLQQLEQALEEADIAPTGIELTPGRLLARFNSSDDQLRAADVIETALGRGYTVALNLAPTTPGWLEALNGRPMYLGLDLRGGVHFLMEVDMDAAVAKAEETLANEIRSQLRGERIRYLAVGRDEAGGVTVRFREGTDAQLAADLIESENPDLDVEISELGDLLSARLIPSAVEEIRRFALQQNITTLRKRVNELGVAEPVIQQQGLNRVVVQLPGVQDTARAKDILGATATLEFRMVDTDHDARQAASTGRVPPGARLYFQRNGAPVLLQRRVMLTGEHITDAASGIDSQTGGPNVSITLDSVGARRFSEATKDNVGKPMAVVFIENKTQTREVDGEKKRIKETVEEVINIATIRERLSARFQITGLDSTGEARDLALLLRAGALAAPIDIVEERTVGPSMGQENIDKGVQAVVVGFVLVLVFMAVYYRVFGLVANVALAVNLVLIVAVLSMLQATLTLPGIAGIVLTVGMAVDANVLIFERIREELKVGNTPQAAISAGYDKALSTIADANITTFIAAVVLFLFGTGPIKGFAVTLSIGICTSMFTAIMGTRSLINLIYGGRRVRQLAI